jgi:Aspartyl/Asparaginyl beta-hydroxylase
VRHFQKIAEGIDVFPLLHAVSCQPDLWNQHPLRTTYPNSPHAQADDILIWFNSLDQAPDAVINDREVEPYPAWRRLPQARVIVFDLLRRVEAVGLGRVMITRLAPGKAITPHADGGAPATYFERYQLMLQALPGVGFTAGNETVQMRTGEAWRFDNTQVHSVANNSADDRIALIIDARLG